MESWKHRNAIHDAVAHGRNRKILWRSFLRQLFICSGVWTSYFILGLCIGAPTVLIPQVRREANSTDAVTDEMASWLSSVYNYAGLPWVLILPILARFFGRKLPYIVLCVTTFIGFIVFYYSNTVAHILISEIIQAIIAASQMTISIMVIAEYTSPRYRGIFLTIKSATFFWGIWASNAIGTFFHWKRIGLLGILCAIYTFISVVLWPESPYWLASQGRFEECAKSHRWLKGDDDEPEKELADLIKSQKEYLKGGQKVSIIYDSLRSISQIISSKELYKPILLCILVLSLYHSSGKLVCSVYAIDIIKKITGSESAAYIGMLILDGITVSGMYAGCIVSKYLKRKTLLIVSSSVGVLFLFIMSVYLYLIEISFIVENKYASIILLTCFSLAISCGPIIMSTSICGEILPLKSRSSSVCIIALFSNFLMGTVLKLSPYIFATLKLYGAFLFYGISSFILIILVYKYLPETKDKTLQEIEDSMRGHYLHHNSDRSIDEGKELVCVKFGEIDVNSVATNILDNVGNK